MQEDYQPQGQTYFNYYTPAQFLPEPSPAPRKRQGVWRVVALCLVCALIGGAAGIGGALIVANQQASWAATEPSAQNTAYVFTGSRESVSVETLLTDTGNSLTAAQVYAQNVNATVGITTSITTNYWGYRTTSAASGSGFVFSSEGYIVTNYHVVEDANTITVTTYAGNSYEAELIGFHKSNDLAVLKIQAENLVPVVLGSSDALHVGDSVVAIGNPLGELTFSLTTGVVSALDREVTFSGNITMDLIQTDCAINSGNSGGALFNMHGEVIGITNAKYSSSGSGSSIDNIGFAIPIDDVYDIVVSIIENGYIITPYLGVSLGDVSSEMQAYGYPRGAGIRQVEADSPAHQAGLQRNDIITQVNGSPIYSASSLTSFVNDTSIGDTLSLTVFRNGEYLQLSVTLGEKIQSALAEQNAQFSPGSYPGSQ